MTIDEAIKELTKLNENHFSQGWAEPNKAIQLSIEALKVVKEYHNYFIREKILPLPGETRE